MIILNASRSTIRFPINCSTSSSHFCYFRHPYLLQVLGPIAVQMIASNLRPLYPPTHVLDNIDFANRYTIIIT